MWHADGWDVQEELAEQMSGLMHKLKHKVVMSYVGVFYITARREWVGIDRHRMDKYLLLARRMTSHVLRYCADRNWAEGAVRDVSEMISRTALGTGGSDGEKGTVDVGLKLHVAEIFVPELRRVAAGRDAVDVGCDPDKENEANGGAPRTVFKRRERKANISQSKLPDPFPLLQRVCFSNPSRSYCKSTGMRRFTAASLRRYLMRSSKASRVASQRKRLRRAIWTTLRSSKN